MSDITKQLSAMCQTVKDCPMDGLYKDDRFICPVAGGCEDVTAETWQAFFDGVERIKQLAEEKCKP